MLQYLHMLYMCISDKSMGKENYTALCLNFQITWKKTAWCHYIYLFKSVDILLNVRL